MFVLLACRYFLVQCSLPRFPKTPQACFARANVDTVRLCRIVFVSQENSEEKLAPGAAAIQFAA
jgi:hypothetical protein